MACRTLVCDAGPQKRRRIDDDFTFGTNGEDEDDVVKSPCLPSIITIASQDVSPNSAPEILEIPLGSLTVSFLSRSEAEKLLGVDAG
jgi:hypothetical protein